jgi:hypothetical protein
MVTYSGDVCLNGMGGMFTRSTALISLEIAQAMVLDNSCHARQLRFRYSFQQTCHDSYRLSQAEGFEPLQR